MAKTVRIILASASPRRKRILNKLGIKFTAIKSGVNERALKHGNPTNYVKKLALLKATAVAARSKDAIVIGADTIVVLDNKIFNKPRGKKEAKRMLEALSGSMHHVITGLCVIDTRTGRKFLTSSSSSVKFRKLDSETVRKYVESGEPLDKAGAYAIQGEGAAFVESINGEFSSILGLPAVKLVKILNEFGYSPLPSLKKIAQSKVD